MSNEVLIKSAASWGSVKSLLGALHSGAKANHLEHGIERAKGMIDKYKGNKGMGWRVDAANRTIANKTPKLSQHTNNYDTYADSLSDSKKKWLGRGRAATSFAYDLPKALLMSPNSRMGILPSVGLYTGLGAMGLNPDPYARVGQLSGAVGAKEIAMQAGNQGGQDAVNNFVTGFDGATWKQRRQYAANPNLVRGMVEPEYYNQLNNSNPPKGIDFGKLLKGDSGFLDNKISGGIANEIRNAEL